MGSHAKNTQLGRPRHVAHMDVHVASSPKCITHRRNRTTNEKKNEVVITSGILNLNL